MRQRQGLVYISIVSILLSCALAIGSADAASDFESEFQAFKQKLAKSTGDAEEDSKVQEKTAVSAEQKPAATSSLGPAGNLPLSRKPPATSFARAGATGRPSAGMALPPSLSQEEQQKKMEEDIAKQKAKMDKENFDDAVDLLLPLEPEQIRELLKEFKKSREAAETPIAFPEPKIEVQTVSLDPSWTPPLVKTSPGYVTTITFLDSTGSPWAIQDIGWAGNFDVTGPEEGGHVVRVVPKTAHGIGNLSVRLVDLITPVTLSLRSGLDEVYYRFDARIPQAGPLAKAPLIEYGGLNTVVGADESLVRFLEGTPPKESEKLKVEGLDSRTKVWRSNGNIYLRTPLTLLSPSWNSSVTSADGMNVYTLSEASVILLSDNGRMVKAQILSDGGVNE